MNFKIGEIEISYNKPPVVIAEIGINHNGSIKVAKEMVDSAHRAGIQIVKHQTHIVEDEMSISAKKTIPGNSQESIYDIMDNCSLTTNEEIELKNYVELKGMEYLSTPFSRKAANFLNQIGVKAFKIGSGECNNLPLLKHISSFGKPIIMSTGMNDLESVKRSVNIIQSYDIHLALMHTTNLYPTPNHLVRLGAMKEMMDFFPHIPIGLSDHTTSNLACLSAVANGACVMERHFTDSMEREGPDIACSMDEENAKNLIEDSKIVYSMLGGRKEASKEEKVTMDFAFSTVVSIKKIKSGETFTKDNIWVKRPGTGEIMADKYESIIGKVAKKNLPNDHHISWQDIELQTKKSQ